MSSAEISAAAHVHTELGPEFSDAVVESFLDRVDRQIGARIDAHIADAGLRRARQVDQATLARRRTLWAGAAIGAVAAGTPLTIFAFRMADELGNSGPLVAIWAVVAVLFGASAFTFLPRRRH